MNIDWVISIGVFLLFIVWAFTFYGQLFNQEADTVSSALEKISDGLLKNLTVKVHAVPLKANVSNVSVSSKILYIDFRWPFGKSSTQVFKAGSSKECIISGNRLYWQSDLVPHINGFTMKYSEQDVALRCNGDFAIVNETPVIPFAIEEKEEISWARVSGMNDTNYSVFKARLGIIRDFNITIENSSSVKLSYGLNSPRATDTFSKKLLRNLEETGEQITIRILTW